MKKDRVPLPRAFGDRRPFSFAVKPAAVDELPSLLDRIAAAKTREEVNALRELIPAAAKTAKRKTIIQWWDAMEAAEERIAGAEG